MNPETPNTSPYVRTPTVKDRHRLPMQCVVRTTSKDEWKPALLVDILASRNFAVVPSDASPADVIAGKVQIEYYKECLIRNKAPTTRPAHAESIVDPPPALQGTSLEIPEVSGELTILLALKQKLLKEIKELSVPSNSFPNGTWVKVIDGKYKDHVGIVINDAASKHACQVKVHSNLRIMVLTHHLEELPANHIPDNVPPPKFGIGDPVYYDCTNGPTFYIQSSIHTSWGWLYKIINIKTDGTIHCQLTDIPEAELTPAENKVNVLDLPPTPHNTIDVGSEVVYKGRVWKVVDVNSDDKVYYTLEHTYENGSKSSVSHVCNDDIKHYTVVLENNTVVNEQGGKQSHLDARFDCIPPVVLRLLAQCLGFGARKYGDENWKNIPQRDNLNHAMNHINEWNRGNRDEPHLVNAMARLTFALWQAVDTNQQPDTYQHPDQLK